MHAFKHLMEALTLFLIACATMRDASNVENEVVRILDLNWVNIELIDGESEAGLIFQNHRREIRSQTAFYLHGCKLEVV